MANQNRLQVVIDDLEEFDREIETIKAERKARLTQAKKDGFSGTVIAIVMKRRKMKPEAREELDSLVNIYEGALGMLNGTPLGEAALRRLSERDPGVEPDPADSEPSAEGVLDDSEDLARNKGVEAAQAGLKVTANPYPPRSPQRAAWDEAWCQAKGSDGMDVPDAWKPTPKPKKGKKGGDDAPPEGDDQ